MTGEQYAAMLAWLHTVWEADERAAYAANLLRWKPDRTLWAGIDARDAEHAARHDPAETLNRIWAERLLAGLAQRFRDAGPTRMAENAEIYDHAVSVIAYGYRDREGYRSEWKPW